MKNHLCEQIDEFGFARFKQFINDETIESLISVLADRKNSSVEGKRNGAVYGVRNLLNLSLDVRKFAEGAEVKSLVENILGENAKPVRAIFFDKTPEANWKVPRHQDLTIAVKEKKETKGFTAWTRKAGIEHVQPPVSILEKTLTVRIHLDDADENNGALKVIPKSHRNGRLSSPEIQTFLKANKIELCRIKRGDAFLMKPLVLHSSSAGTSPKHRRVIHIEFSAENLPNGLQWYGS
ncbi:MAG TPA: phytanoyl-CoA dioxygenase family protein [Pyrinomonadaceae bacterium]|nr:phytanoyl-CoA dioxygenase family protein [Pyrinomonadaceae bacterium]